MRSTSPSHWMPGAPAASPTRPCRARSQEPAQIDALRRATPRLDRRPRRPRPAPMDTEFPPLSSWVWAASPGRPAVVPPAAVAVLRTPWGGRAHRRRWVPHRDGPRNGPCCCGGCASRGGCRPEDPPLPIPPLLVLDPPPVVDPSPPLPPVTHQGYTVATLTAARAEHVARQAHLWEAALVWERKCEAVDAIAAQITAAE